LIEQSPPEVREMFITYPTTDEIAIIVDYEGLKDLSADEARATIQHETAHYVLGHVEANLAAGAGNEIVIDEDAEFAADAYAAQKVSAAAMRSALEKMAALLGGFAEEDELLAERLRRLV
jgi:Zn-dependent protease with chaperone function